MNRLIPPRLGVEGEAGSENRSGTFLQFCSGYRLYRMADQNKVAIVGGLVLVEARLLPCAGNADDMLSLMEQPRQGDLRGCDALVRGHRAHGLDQLEVLLEVLAHEARAVPSVVVGREVVG